MPLSQRDRRDPAGKGDVASCPVAPGMVRLGVVVDLCQSPGLPVSFLHGLYQSYHLPWLRWINRLPHAWVTLCVNSWLLNLWAEQNWDGGEGLELLRTAYDLGRVELCATASHHAILPLVAEAVAFRQVKRHGRLLADLLHPEWAPAGLVPPQLAYGHELLRLAQPLGLRWCLADDLGFGALHGGVPYDHVLRCGGLLLPLCSRFGSQQLLQHCAHNPRSGARQHQQGLLQWSGGGDVYQILRVPGEALAGVDLPSRLGEWLNSHAEAGSRIMHLSALLDQLPQQPGEVPPGSCRLELDDFWSGRFFAPWQGPAAWDAARQAGSALEQWHARLDELLASHTFEDEASAGAAGLRHMADVLEQAQGR